MHRAGRISPLPFVSRVPTLGQQLAHTLSLRQGALPSLVNQVNFAPSNSNSKLAPLSCQTGRTAVMQLARRRPDSLQHNLLCVLAGGGRSFIVPVLALLSVFNRISRGSGTSCLVSGTLRFRFRSLPLRFLGVNVCG